MFAAAGIAGMTFIDLVKWFILIAAVIAIAVIVFRVLGWQPPAWSIQILMVVVAVIVAFVAINVIVSLW